MYDLAKSGDPIPEIEDSRIPINFSKTFYPGSKSKIPFMLVGYDGELNKIEANKNLKPDLYEP